jgi:predicted esterase
MRDDPGGDNMRGPIPVILGLVAVWSFGCGRAQVVGDDDAGSDDDDVVDDDDVADDDDDAADDDDTSDDDAGDDDTTGEPPEWCVDAEFGVLQDITTTPASPYFVHHPPGGAAGVPIVVWLGGGDITDQTARSAFERNIAGGDGMEQVRAVLPYSTQGLSLLDHPERVIEVLDEVLACYGGDVDHIHVAGNSNGGCTAFQLAIDYPGTFATLLGAPGVFWDYPSFDDAAILAALGDGAVFNGVGELDSGWLQAVQYTHQHIEGLGIESTLEIFPGQGHALGEEYDETIFVDFWLSH